MNKVGHRTYLYKEFYFKSTVSRQMLFVHDREYAICGMADEWGHSLTCLSARGSVEHGDSF